MKTIFTSIVLAVSVLCSVSGECQSLEGRAVWGHPGVAGNSRESIAEFAEKLKGAHINTLVMMVKGIGGEIYYPSEKFPDSVRKGYKDFDFPAILIDECHKRDIEVHAWFCDFPEGANSAADKAHPEWSMRNANDKTTDSEILRGRNYGMRWMCPARRPGYTDQWLVPLIDEFAQKYDIDAIHHDYVRYPGDLAPDTYCFCDYCLEEIPKWAGYYKQAYPDEAFHPNYDRPYLEAHWEPGPRVLPENWANMPRSAKSGFLLEGGFFNGGRYDLDYFFYNYRIHWIAQFTRDVFEKVRVGKPEMEFSAAVFKNPVHSGRFIGQDWREFSDWVQYMMPMDYRSHYPGTFEQHLDLLEESIMQQKQWACDAKHLWPGIASYQLYSEESAFHRAARRIVENDEIRDDFASVFTAVEASLKKTDGAVADALKAYFNSPNDANRAKAVISLKSVVEKYPKYYRPPYKFVQTLQRVKDTGVKGMVVFAIGDVINNGLLDELGEFFAQ
ncbi:MAG: family 10 glycosylhydrolase [Candidatus Hinthialibacter antarcticus]|nr:family 10 glycosylhydrolase [Candidatus Hinthialibacter antarcticus]